MAWITKYKGERCLEFRCPHCRKRVSYDSCEHIVFWYDATNCSYERIDEEFVAFVGARLRGMQEFKNAYDWQGQLKSIPRPRDLSEHISEIEYFEECDTDHRSYYMGNIYGTCSSEVRQLFEQPHAEQQAYVAANPFPGIELNEKELHLLKTAFERQRWMTPLNTVCGVVPEEDHPSIPKDRAGASRLRLKGVLDTQNQLNWTVFPKYRFQNTEAIFYDISQELRAAGHTPLVCGTWVGFSTIEDYIAALKYMFSHSVVGWHSQWRDLFRFRICSPREYAATEDKKIHLTVHVEYGYPGFELTADEKTQLGKAHLSLRPFQRVHSFAAVLRYMWKHDFPGWQRYGYDIVYTFGLTTEQEFQARFRQSLMQIWQNRLPGWIYGKRQCIREGICSEEEFNAAERGHTLIKNDPTWIQISRGVWMRVQNGEQPTIAL